MTELETKLLSCPFCGSDKATVYKWNGAMFHSLSCQNEDCPLDSALENRFESKNAAILWWNKRYNQPYIPSTLEE